MKSLKKLFVCNWKSNPQTLAQAQTLTKTAAEAIKGYEGMVLIPPFPYLDTIAQVLGKDSPIRLGAQDIAPLLASDSKNQPSITGEVNGDMLSDLGVSYVLVGHSERRYILGEDDALINEKMRAAIRNTITPIICVGEREKTSPKEALQEAIGQLSLAIEGIVDEEYVIAYEPVWAIGGNKEVDPAYAAQIIAGIKKYRERKVLYGGSVNCENISSLLLSDETDGFLVGSASLSGESIACLLEAIKT